VFPLRLIYFQIEGSIELCYTSLKELATGVNEATGKQTATKSQADRFGKDPKLQAILTEMEKQMARPGGFSMHPKMDKLKTLLIEHFAQKGLDNDSNAAGDLDSDSRVMVFTSFRQTVDLIVEMLAKEKPLIRAVPFIGQGTDKNGKMEAEHLAPVYLYPRAPPGWATTTDRPTVSFLPFLLRGQQCPSFDRMPASCGRAAFKHDVYQDACSRAPSRALRSDPPAQGSPHAAPTRRTRRSGVRSSSGSPRATGSEG
jgi:hypothetical protein